MCFNKTEESKLLIAKRDITVYKVGCFADEVYSVAGNKSLRD